MDLQAYAFTAQRADLAIFAPCCRKALKAVYYIRDG